MHIARLREATEEDHAAVEGALTFMAPDLSLSSYRTALERMYGFVRAWETLAEATASSELLAFVRVRARRGLLATDILSLRGEVDAYPTASLPVFESQPELLGALYVMEGSRLGGQVIARHVETTLGFKEGCGTTYFRGFEDKTGSNWKELLSLLASEIPESESVLTIAAARSMFHAFGSWMTHVAPLPQTRKIASAGDAHGG